VKNGRNTRKILEKLRTKILNSTEFKKKNTVDLREPVGLEIRKKRTSLKNPETPGKLRTEIQNSAQNLKIKKYRGLEGTSGARNT
jgi:hypothetical protein